MISPIDTVKNIAECEECKELYEKTKKELPVKDALDESMEIRRSGLELLYTVPRGCLSTTGKIRLIVFRFPILSVFVPSKDIQVTELYELENGDIYCTLQTEKPFFTVSMGEFFLQSFWRGFD